MSSSRRKAGQIPACIAATALVFAVHLPAVGMAQEMTDPVTGLAREPIHVTAWPGGKRVAVSFALFVEEFGFGEGPVYRPDMTSRNPDLVNEAFRQYAIDWGVARVGRLFKELDVPLTIVLSSEFPGKYPSVWKDFRASQPNAPIVDDLVLRICHDDQQRSTGGKRAKRGRGVLTKRRLDLHDFAGPVHAPVGENGAVQSWARRFGLIVAMNPA